LLKQNPAPYFTDGEASEKITACWIILHGYAQSAQEFILPFAHLHNENTLIVAPEGLSRFYRKSYSEVVASWMTRAQRMCEVEDYIICISSVYRKRNKYIAKNRHFF
jgi:hypothetical protein